jgi:hypothetical protein
VGELVVLAANVLLYQVVLALVAEDHVHLLNRGKLWVVLVVGVGD